MDTERCSEFCIQFLERLYRRRRKDPELVQLLSHLYAATGNSRGSLRMDKRYARLEPMSPVAHYNLACDYALAQKVPEALNALETAIALGYNDSQWIRDDIDLDPIRREPAFRALMEHAFTSSK